MTFGFIVKSQSSHSKVNFTFYSFLDSGLPANEFGGTLEFTKIQHS